VGAICALIEVRADSNDVLARAWLVTPVRGFARVAVVKPSRIYGLGQGKQKALAVCALFGLVLVDLIALVGIDHKSG
jgi:hypothetical protein